MCGSRGRDVVGPPEGLISALGFVEREQLLSAQLPLPLPPPASGESLQYHVPLSGPLSVVGWSTAPHRVGVRYHLLDFPAPPASGFPGKHLGFSGVINCPLGTTLLERNSLLLYGTIFLDNSFFRLEKYDKADWLFISWIMSFAFGAGKHGGPVGRAAGSGQGPQYLVV